MGSGGSPKILVHLKVLGEYIQWDLVTYVKPYVFLQRILFGGPLNTFFGGDSPPGFAASFPLLSSTPPPVRAANNRGGEQKRSSRPKNHGWGCGAKASQDNKTNLLSWWRTNYLLSAIKQRKWCPHQKNHKQALHAGGHLK